MRAFILFFITLVTTISTISAREVYILNNSWRFFFKDENTSDNARLVRVPHTWNSDALYDKGSLLKTTANYRRQLFVPQKWQGKRLFVRFNGVMSVADVFVNGRCVGSHKGGYTAFAIEITDYVNYGVENTLLVEVSNAYRSDVLPTSTEQNLYGGIYRDVELIVADKTTISPLYYGTEGVIVNTTKVSVDAAEGNIGVCLLGKKDTQCAVTVDIVSPDGYVATTKSVKAKIDGKMLNVPFVVGNPELWSLQRPNIYRVDVIVGADTVSVNTGFRDVKVGPERLMTINGKRTMVRGVNLCHDNAFRGNALTQSDYKHDFATICSVGANSIRSVGGPHAQSLYDMCDKEGMLVWVDMPLSQSPFFSDTAYYSTSEFEKNGIEQLTEIVLQNIHHPSVVMWGVFSHLRSRSAELLAYVKSLNALAKRLDPSRPTVACSDQDGDINFITDLIVWQQSVGWDSGSISDIDIWQKALKTNWGHLCQAVCYGEGDGQSKIGNISPLLRERCVPEGRQTLFHEGYVSRIDEQLFWGVWINNMFDFGSVRHGGAVRNTGLVDFEHNNPKDAFYLYKTRWNKSDATLHIVNKNSEVRMKDRQVIKVYCSQGVPQLTINGDSVALRNCAQGIFVTDSLNMSGLNTVIATADNLRDSTTFTIGNYLPRK